MGDAGDRFDRFSTWSSEKAGGAAAFTIAVALVLIWAPTFLIIRNVDTWQLIINTMTTIITFGMVFLIQHAQRKFELAVNVKLDAIIAASLRRATGCGGSRSRPRAISGAPGTKKVRRWWRRQDSNPPHPACKAGALPDELRPRLGGPDSVFTAQRARLGTDRGANARHDTGSTQSRQDG
jgi:hypothetical protein